MAKPKNKNKPKPGSKKAQARQERKDKRAGVRLTAQDYGFTTAVMKKYPKLKKLTDRAIKEEWSPERYRGKVKDTDFWTSRTKAQRDYDINSVSDPKQAQKNLEDRYNELKRMAQQMGVAVDENTLRSTAQMSVRNGLDEDDLRGIVGVRWQAPTDLGEGIVSGMASETLDALTATAAAYGVPMARETAQENVRKVLSGDVSVESLEDQYREQAKRLFPTLAGELDKGFTVADIADPYLELAANELGVSKAQMNLTDPKWTKALTFQPANGEPRPATMDEWQRTIRTDSTYGWDTTAGARAQAAKLGLGLAQRMGGQ